MRVGAANVKVATGSFSCLPAERRTVDYGGSVGELLAEIEVRMTGSASARATTTQARSDIDFVRMVSISAGYIGLAAGFALSAAALVWMVL